MTSLYNSVTDGLHSYHPAVYFEWKIFTSSRTPSGKFFSSRHRLAWNIRFFWSILFSTWLRSSSLTEDWCSSSSLPTTFSITSPAQLSLPVWTRTEKVSCCCCCCCCCCLSACDVLLVVVVAMIPRLPALDWSTHLTATVTAAPRL